MSRALRTTAALIAAVSLGACAVRLGGPRPLELQVAALAAPAGATADATAQRLAGSDVVLLSADADSAWFAAVARQAGLELSGPGTTAGRGLAFMTRLELLGDTALVLQVPGGGSVHMQDALYRVDRDRLLDLMMVRFDGPDLRRAVQTLLGYIATDVGAAVPVLLAVDGTQAVADSAALLMRAYYSNAQECRVSEIPAAAGTGVRLLYGPSARIGCQSARLLDGQPPGVSARVVIAR
jgi:hypothetical protein